MPRNSSNPPTMSASRLQRERTSETLPIPKKACNLQKGSNVNKNPSDFQIAKNADLNDFHTPLSSSSSRFHSSPNVSSPGWKEFLVKQLGEQSAYIENSIKTMETKIEAKLDVKLNAIQHDLQNVKSEMETVSDNLNMRMDNFEAKFNELSHTVVMNRETIERMPKVNGLAISGVPYQQDEELSVYFDRMCAKLGINPMNAVDFMRYKSMSKRPTNEAMEIDNNADQQFSHTFVVQFVFKSQRDDFFGAYLSTLKKTPAEQLTLKDIGLESDKRIYVNENLTRSNHLLRKEAKRMKRRGFIHNVVTRNGAVFIKRRANAKNEFIYSAEQLN